MYAVKIRCLHTLAEMAALRPKINALNLASTRPDPFSTFEFYENLLRRGISLTGGTRSRVWFLAAFIERELVGYLALEEVTEKVLWHRLTRLGFLVAHDADRPHVVARTEHLGIATEMFYEYLRERRGEWDLLELQQQDAASTLYPLPAGVRLQGCWVRSWPNLDNGTIRVQWATLQEYFDALAPKFRSNFLRQMRKLFASGEVELLTSADPMSTPALLELYYSIEERSWKAHTDLTVSGTRQRRDYVRALLDAHQPMQAVILIVMLDGVPVAGLMSGAFAGPAEKGLYALHMAFDEHLSTAAPGSLTLLMGMRYAIEGRYAFLNLLSGFGHYKTRWLAEMTATRCAQIYRVGSLFFWRRALGDLWRWSNARLRPTLRRLLPARSRAIGAPADEREHAAAPTRRARPITAAEHATFAKLIAEARRGKHEWLSAQELVAAMPLAPRRAPATPQSQAVPRQPAPGARRVVATTAPRSPRK